MRIRWIATALVLAAATAATAQPSHPYAPGRIIVKYRESVRPGGPAPLPAGTRVALERRFHSGAELMRIGGMTVEEALAHYASDPRVEYAEPDYEIRIDDTGRVVPNDPRLGELWGFDNTGQTGGVPDADIDAPEAWTIQTGGDVLIGVVDTGIDWHHEDLAANVWVNPGEIPGNNIDDDHNGYVDDIHGWDFVNNDNDPMDDHGHGTHVSGTIAAMGDNGIGVAGVCWKARLVGIKTLNANGVGYMSAAAAGIEYAVRVGVRLTSNSWGSASFSQVLDDALAEAADAGMLVVAAAGNDRSDNDFLSFYPACYDYDNIIAVANTDASDTLSVTSNWGAESVDLAAPGERILSCFPGNQYALLSGTSMATPHVSGTIGLVLTEAPLMTPAEVKALLLSTVDPVPALQGRVVSNGRLNAYNALSALDATPPGRIDDLRVVETGSNTVTLEWTARGDDGDVGTAAAYDVRYADSPVKPSNFDEATPVDDPPAPLPAGSRQTLRVSGLAVKTTYFFAVRALDEHLNASGLSKVVAGRTRGEPELSFTPDTFDGDVLTGATATQTLHISNTGKGTIDFAIAPGAQGWASAKPSSGTVGARETVEVTVVLDALGLAGGDYADTVTMTTNDPALPSVAIPARLAVTSAPQVTVSDDTVDFGAWLVGLHSGRDIQVVNRGDRPLDVSAAEVTDQTSGFSAEFAPFTLAPAAEGTISVNFAPRVTGKAATTLRITTNDPDDAVTSVALTGRGVPPPDIQVAADTLTMRLGTGTAGSVQVQIANAGEGDLEWRASVDDGAGEPAPETPYRDVAGVRVLYDSNHLNLHWFNYNVIIGDLRARGADVVVSHEPFTPEYLAGFDAVWIAEAFTSLSSAEREALVDWVRAGGGLLIEGDYDRSLPDFDRILADLLCGIDVSGRNGATGITNAIEEHAITRGVQDVFLSRVQASLRPLVPPARPLIYDVDGGLNTAWSRSGEGRVVVMGDQNLANHRMGNTGNEALGNRIFDWLALGVSWVDVSPWSGVVAPSQSATLAVRLDATGIAGAHDARLVVWSNDPDTPAVVVPLHLDADAGPDIFVGASAARLDTTAVGQSSRVDILVGNKGTQTLDVTRVSSSTAQFSVMPHSLSLAPGASDTLVVNFAPSSPGEHAAVITLESNDPDEATAAIRVSGAAFTGTPVIATTSAVSAELGPPERTMLHPNVPNPFNPATSVAFDLRSASPVTIVIYDVRGQAVRTLVDDVKPAGRYAVSWDGTTDGGAHVATGVYFCRFTAGRVTQTRKMILLK